MDKSLFDKYRELYPFKIILNGEVYEVTKEEVKNLSTGEVVQRKSVRDKK